MEAKASFSRPVRRDGDALQRAPDSPPRRPVRWRGSAGERTVKVDRYASAHSISLGIVRGRGARADAAVRMSVDQARGLIAALEAACEAITLDAADYHASGDDERRATTSAGAAHLREVA